MNTASIVMFGGVTLGLVIIVALLIRRDANVRANLLLAASLSCSMAYLVSMALIQGQYVEGSRLPSLLGLSYLLGPPLMLGYVKMVTHPGYRLGMRHTIHLLPWLCLLIWVISSEGVIGKESLEEARQGWPPNQTALLAVVIYVLSAGYMAAAVQLLRNYRASFNEQYSYQSRQSLRWLLILVGVYLALSLAGLFIALVRWVPGMELWPRTLYSSGMIICLYYLIAFMGIAQPAAAEFAEGTTPGLARPPNNPDAPDIAPTPRYETSRLAHEDLHDIWTRLERYMGEQEPYLDSKLRIADLARAMEIPPHHLSQAINQVAGKNFFEFVNGFRVEKAKTLLKEGAGSTISVAFDAGFNSQSAFYRQFKEITGQTPKQYRRKSGPN